MTNQSFDDETVGITIEIDGVVVVDDDFDAEDQHHVVEYDLDLEADVHVITMTSDTGATLTEGIRIAPGEPRFTQVAYWYAPGDTPRSFTFGIQDEPILIE